MLNTILNYFTKKKGYTKVNNNDTNIEYTNI